jgi:hypothetical protein
VLPRLLLVEDAERLGGFRNGLRIRVEPEEARVEDGHVLRQQFLRVALGVDRYEKHLHLGGIAAEQLHGLGHPGHGGRTYIRALCVAEEDHHRLAAEIGHGARLASVVGQREVPRVIRLADVGVAELRPAVAAGQQQGQREEKQSKHQNLK